jgi:hypothetical protein
MLVFLFIQGVGMSKGAQNLVRRLWMSAIFAGFGRGVSIASLTYNVQALFCAYLIYD